MFIQRKYMIESDGILDNFKRNTANGFSPHDRQMIDKHKNDKVFKITIFRAII